MVIRFSYEELQALKQGVAVVLDRIPAGSPGAVAAPPRERVQVERLAGRLEGDISISTLTEQEGVATAVRTIARAFLDRMNEEISRTHPASEDAVARYFEYAHTRAVLDRVEEAGSHMRALIEIVTGDTPDDEAAENFVFPD